jgi:hypothetical protein
MDIKVEEKIPKHGWMYTAGFNQFTSDSILLDISSKINNNIKYHPLLKKQYIIWVVLKNYFKGIPPFDIYLENLNNYGLLGHSVNSILKYLDFVDSPVAILPRDVNNLIKSYAGDSYGIVSYRVKEITIIQPLLVILQHMKNHGLLNIEYENICGLYQSRKRTKTFCGIFFKPIFIKEYNRIIVHNVNGSNIVYITNLKDVDGCVICFQYISSEISIRLCSYCMRTACRNCGKYYTEVYNNYRKLCFKCDRYICKN